MIKADLDADSSEILEKDYSYCKICKHNFNNGKKHYYNPKHLSNLNRILSKMSIKVCLDF